MREDWLMAGFQSETNPANAGASESRHCRHSSYPEIQVETPQRQCQLKTPLKREEETHPSLNRTRQQSYDTGMGQAAANADYKGWSTAHQKAGHISRIERGLPSPPAKWTETVAEVDVGVNTEGSN
ncbi:hypothetical protein AOLI_G00048640 [Acnodon oligacanthus]